MRPHVSSSINRPHRAATITTQFEQPIDVVWTLFSDAAKLARWWGPPGCPMTVRRHELHDGGITEFSVELPEGAIRGTWSILRVDPPRHLTFVFRSDGLEPTDMDVELRAATPSSTILTITVRFRTDEILRHALDIGFVEGVTRSVARSHEIVDRSPSGN